MHLLENVRRVLVVCPLSAVGVWEQEIPKHSGVPWTLVYSGDTGFPPTDEGIEWRVINFEQTYLREMDGRSWFAVDKPELFEFKADLIIVDESHHIGNPSTLASKNLYRLGKRARFKLIMTGTMFHRKPFYIFGQMKFLDDSLFGTSWTHFKRHIAVMGGYGGYEVLRYQNLKPVMRKVRSKVFIQKYVPLRDPVINVLPVHLTGRGLESYVQMEENDVLHVGKGEGEVIISPIILSRHLRLMQIAGGFVKSPSGSGKYYLVGTDKIRLVEDRFNEYMQQDIHKVVVGCRFLPELKAVATMAKKAGFVPILLHGGVKRDERHRRIRIFNETKRPAMFIAQISTGKEAIDLSSASVMMFYSLSESFVEHDQFSRRIEKFNDTRTLMYDFPVVMGTRDEVTFNAIQLKQDVAQYMQDNPTLVEEITMSRKTGTHR